MDKYKTNRYNKKSFLGYEFGRTTSGDMRFYGRKPQSQRGSGFGGQNKYQSTPSNSSAPSAPSGGNLSSQFSGDTFGSDATALQSDAMSGQIYGGTSDQRAEAASLAGPGSTKPPKGGGGGVDGSAALGAGLGMAGAAISELDTDDKYGGMDVAASTVKFAAMGAMAGPIGAGVGAVVGLGVGLIKKNKFEKEARKAETKRKSTLQNKEDQALSRGEAAEFFESQAGATAGAYGVGDIDRFTNKYS
jgi:hypothetical protein